MTTSTHRPGRPERGTGSTGGTRGTDSHDKDGSDAAASGSGTDRRRGIFDLAAVTGAALLFAAAAVVGHAYDGGSQTLRLRWPPLYAYWMPHWGPGTAAASVVAVLVIAWGPRLAGALPWRALLPGAWAGSMAWGWSLTLIDGWHRGVATRLTTAYEYLQSVGDVDDVGAALRGFTGRILMDAPDNWPPHVAGHPPAALLTFVGLDRIGLGGGVWATAFVITAGSSAVAAVLVTVRALVSEETARRCAPYAVLAPATVWTAVSADGYFAAVAAWALALLALAATGKARAPHLTATASGLLFGLACYLSYGLILMGFLALAVLTAARTVRPVPLVLLGMAPWFVLFTAAGFWWFEGWSTLVERYYQGAARVRPYGYFVWANLAAQTAVVGPAVVASLRRAAAGAGALADGRGSGPRVHAGPEHTGQPPRQRPRLRQGHLPRHRHRALLLLVAGAVCCVLAADLSGMSKGETERIWLPFTLWLLPATALLPLDARRWWLAAQAALALTVNHLLITGW